MSLHTIKELIEMGYDLDTKVSKPIQDPVDKERKPELKYEDINAEHKLPPLTMKDLILWNDLSLDSDIFETIDKGTVTLGKYEFAFDVLTSYVKDNEVEEYVYKS